VGAGQSTETSCEGSRLTLRPTSGCVKEIGHAPSRVHSTRTYLPMKMEQTECSETSEFKIQTPGNNPKESIQHSEHGESLKSRKTNVTF